jgi:hypothetical protein
MTIFKVKGGKEGKVVQPDRCDKCGGKLTRYKQWLTGNNIYNNIGYSDGYLSIRIFALCWDCVLKEYRNSVKEDVNVPTFEYSTEGTIIKTTSSLIARAREESDNPSNNDVLTQMRALYCCGFPDLLLMDSAETVECTLEKKIEKRFLRPNKEEIITTWKCVPWSNKEEETK